MLPKEALKELKDIHFKEFGQKLSEQKILELGTNLLNLFKNIYKPIPKN